MTVLDRILRILRCRKGMIAAEFAAMMPVLALFLLGVFESGRYIVAIQKVDRIAAAMADYVSQSEKVTNGELANLFDAVPNIASPYSFDGGVVIVSSLYKSSASDPTKVVWQRHGGGNLSATSAIGIQGGNAILPSGMTLAANEGMVAAEAMMDFAPLFLDAVFPSLRITRTTYYRPRKSAQVTLAAS